MQTDSTFEGLDERVRRQHACPAEVPTPFWCPCMVVHKHETPCLPVCRQLRAKLRDRGELARARALVEHVNAVTRAVSMLKNQPRVRKRFVRHLDPQLLRAARLCERVGSDEAPWAEDDPDGDPGEWTSPMQRLPNLCASLQFLNFWHDTCPRNIPILHILCKSLPQRCQYRNLGSIIAMHVRNDEAVSVFMHALILSSVLGAFEGSDFDLPFSGRVHVARGGLGSGIGTFVETHSFVAFYALREFLLESVRANPALHTVLNKTYQWTDFADCVFFATNSGRRRLAGRGGSFGAFNADLESHNRRQHRWMYKLQRRTFVGTVLHRAEGAKRAEALAREVRTLPVWTVAQRLDPDKVSAPNTFVGFMTHPSLGVSPAACAALRSALEYWKGDNSLALVNDAISVALQHESFVRAALAVGRRLRYGIILIDEGSYQQQCAQLCKRAGVRAPGLLGPLAGCVHTCDRCRKVFGFVVTTGAPLAQPVLSTFRCESGDARGAGTPARLRTPAFGERAAASTDVWRPAAHKTVCAPSEKKEHWAVGVPRALQADDNLKVCPAGHPLLRVSLLGRIVRLFGSLYTLCTRCGTPATWSVDMRGDHGFECGLCAKDEKFMTLWKAELAMRQENRCVFCPSSDSRPAGSEEDSTTVARTALDTSGGAVRLVDLRLCPRHATICRDRHEVKLLSTLRTDAQSVSQGAAGASVLSKRR